MPCLSTPALPAGFGRQVIFACGSHNYISAERVAASFSHSDSCDCVFRSEADGAHGDAHYAHRGACLRKAPPELPQAAGSRDRTCHIGFGGRFRRVYASRQDFHADHGRRIGHHPDDKTTLYQSCAQHRGGYPHPENLARKGARDIRDHLTRWSR